MKRDWDKPRCPVCHMPLSLWSTPLEAVFADCGDCGWRWSE